MCRPGGGRVYLSRGPSTALHSAQRVYRNSRRAAAFVSKVGAALRAVPDSRVRRVEQEAEATHAATPNERKAALHRLPCPCMRRPGFMLHAPPTGVRDGSESRPYLGLRTPAAGVSIHPLRMTEAFAGRPRSLRLHPSSFILHPSSFAPTPRLAGLPSSLQTASTPLRS